MSDQWVETTLGNVLEPLDVRAGTRTPGVEDLVLSVTEKRGIIPQTEVYTKRVATADVSKYKVLSPLDIAYNPYLLWANAVGQWLGSGSGVTSPVYECFRVKVGNDPRFWGLVLESGVLTPYFDSTAVGSIQRRRRTTVPVFMAAPVTKPPLPVQGRIVDLVGAVDAHIANLEAEAHAGAVALDRLLESWHEGLMLRDRQRCLGDMVSPRSGPSWAASDESAEAVPGSMRVVKITNTRPDGALDMSGRTYVTGLPRSTLTLDDRSLIIIRTNGNRARIGNVYRPEGEAIGCAVSAFQFIARAETVDQRDFLYWWLRTPAEQAAMSGAASGSTGLGNLAAGWLKSRRLPEPDLTAIPLLEAADSTLRHLRSESAAARKLRSRLLEALLSREVEIPESYDRLLDAGVAV